MKMGGGARLAGLLITTWTVGVSGCDSDELFVVPEFDAGAETKEPADLGPFDLGTVAFPDFGALDLGPTAPATEPIYIHTGTTLYSYDPDAHRTVRVGDFRASGQELDPMVDIAIDEFGRMLGGTGTSRDPKRVYRVDPATAECILLYEVPDNLNGMAFDGNGRLVAAGDTLRVLDPDSGQTVFTFNEAGERFTTSGDVVGLPDGKLYWTVRGERFEAPDRLVRLDPVSGEATLLGSLSKDNLFGLGYASGELYGFTSAGEVLVIDPATGRVIDDRTLSGRWFGATANPVTWP